MGGILLKQDKSIFEQRKEDYENIFSVKIEGKIDPVKTMENKAAAFDKIAEHYYLGNFGTMQKSDFEVLLFSIYLEQILDKSEEDMNSYSDYELSKKLGITQDKVRNLKVKKELKYPYEKFSWKESFKRVIPNMRYKNGFFFISINDRNLYLELKHHIENMGGFIEATLNSNLLKIPAEYFIDLIVDIYGNNDRKYIDKKIRKYMAEKYNDEKILEEENFFQYLIEHRNESIVNLVESTLGALGDVGIIALSLISDSAVKVMRRNKK